MHTEEQAKKLWCPFARTIERWPDGSVTRSRNRIAAVQDEEGTFDLSISLQPYGCQCIASECMAWRWADRPLRNTPDPNASPHDKGYCGLAGSPW